ncbi:MAG: small basic protein [Thermoguttaceae bacterium]|nr:small basic protein [Thermoguttaceae bacterium]MDW8039746.1 small basic protein [Thermoguttaceae bacterium]
MSIDKTLKIRRATVRNRCVLKRAERIARLKELDRWHEGDSPFGLPKVRVYKITVKKKKKSKKEEAAQAAGTGTPSSTPAASSSGQSKK